MFDAEMRAGRVLITGGAGFIGHSLVGYFQKFGLEIVIADSRRRIEKYANYIGNDIQYLYCDWPSLPDISTYGVFDYIVHLAWSSNPASSMSDVAQDASNNILGTIELLEQLKRTSHSKLVFLSSGGTVYGNGFDGPISECEKTEPVSAYGISKLACEKYVNLYSHISNSPSVILRLGNPYGPYQLNGTPVGVISSFVNKVRQNKTIQIFGDGENKRDFIHIDDVARAVGICLAYDGAEGTYNLGSGFGYSINEILGVIQELISRSLPIEYLPDRRSDVREIVLDTGKIESELGFVCDIPLIKGVSQMLEVSGVLNNDNKLLEQAS